MMKSGLPNNQIKVLLPFTYQNILLIQQIGITDHGLNICHLFVIDAHPTALYQFLGFSLAGKGTGRS